MQEISIHSVLKCQYQVKGSSSKELKVERLGSTYLHAHIASEKSGKNLSECTYEYGFFHCANKVNKLVLVHKKQATFAYQ